MSIIRLLSGVWVWTASAICVQMQRFVKMMAVTQAGQGISAFQQGAAQTLIGQRRAQRFRHQLEIGPGRSVTGGDVLEGQQANGFAWAMSGTQSDWPACVSADDSR